MISPLTRISIIAVAAALVAIPAHATSVKEFDAMKSADQTAFLVGFFDKMTHNIGEKDPALASKIRTFFFRNEEGKPFSPGMENIYAQLTAIDLKAKKGKADPAKIQMESIIVYVARQAFPPNVQ